MAKLTCPSFLKWVQEKGKQTALPFALLASDKKFHTEKDALELTNGKEAAHRLFFGKAHFDASRSKFKFTMQDEDIAQAKELLVKLLKAEAVEPKDYTILSEHADVPADPGSGHVSGELKSVALKRRAFQGDEDPVETGMGHSSYEGRRRPNETTSIEEGNIQQGLVQIVPQLLRGGIKSEMLKRVSNKILAEVTRDPVHAQQALECLAHLPPPPAADAPAPLIENYNSFASKYLIFLEVCDGSDYQHVANELKALLAKLKELLTAKDNLTAAILLTKLQGWLEKTEAKKAEDSRTKGNNQAMDRYAEQLIKQVEQNDKHFKELTGQKALYPTPRQEAAAKKYHLHDAEFYGIRIYTENDYLYINPAVSNEQNHPARFRDEEGKGEDFMTKTLTKLGYPPPPEKAPADPELLKEHEEYVKTYQQKRKNLIAEGTLHAALVASALKKLPKQTGLTLYRGMRLNETEYKNRFGGAKEISSAAFSSASVSEATARDFANGKAAGLDQTISVYCVIKANEAYDIQELSTNPREGELLIPPGAPLVIASITDDDVQETGTPPATAWKRIFLVPKE